MYSESEIREMRRDPVKTEKEIQRLTKELADAQTSGWRTREGELSGRLGEIKCRVTGEGKEGIECYDNALSVARKNHDRVNEVNYLSQLGRVHFAYNEGPQSLMKALDFNEQALSIAKEIGDRNSECFIFGSLVTIYRFIGAVEKAVEFCRHGLSLAREIRDRYSEGIFLENMGTAYMELGEEETAKRFKEQARSVYEEIGKSPADLFKKLLGQFDPDLTE